MYYELTINATNAETDIWLVDENGHLVQKAIGSLSLHVLGGSYFVVFGLHSTACCSINLSKSVVLSQAELEILGTRPKPAIKFPGDEGYIEYDVP